MKQVRLIELRIQFNPQTGEVSATGPLNDRILCYGMLEEAKQIIQKHNTGPGGNGGKIVIPQMRIK